MRPADPREHIAQLVAGKIVVPVVEPPLIEDSRISGWTPARVAKPDGSQWVIAFTTKERASQFCDSDPDYGLYIDVDTQWVLYALPPDCGIVFDPGTEDMFQWSAAGIAKYTKDILGWE